MRSSELDWWSPGTNHILLWYPHNKGGGGYIWTTVSMFHCVCVWGGGGGGAESETKMTASILKQAQNTEKGFNVSTFFKLQTENTPTNNRLNCQISFILLFVSVLLYLCVCGLKKVLALKIYIVCSDNLAYCLLLEKGACIENVHLFCLFWQLGLLFVSVCCLKKVLVWKILHCFLCSDNLAYCLLVSIA